MKRWYVLAVYERKEARVRAWLERLDYEVMVPIERHVRLVKGVATEVPELVFPEYVFVRFDRNTQPWKRVNYAPGAIKLLPITAENPVAIPHKAADLVASYCNRMVDERPRQLARGERVEVDLLGTTLVGVVERQRKDEVKIWIDSLAGGMVTVSRSAARLRT